MMIVDANGFYYEGSRNRYPYKEVDEGQVEAAREVIGKLYEKAKTFKKYCTTYGLKHEMEREAGKYISNGAAIKAFILEGFEVIPDRIGGMNGFVKFNAMRKRD